MPDIGDFSVTESEAEFARRAFDGQSERSKEIDTEKRAPITTSFERWGNNTDDLDFPGVDTPSESPNVLPKDLMQPESQRPNLSPEASADAPTQPIQEGNPEEDRLANTDVSLAPEEAFEGVGATDPNALGGNFTDEGERAPITEDEPPETALRRQSLGSSKYLDSDNSPEAVADVYEQGDFDISLSQFRQEVERELENSPLPLDRFAAADTVAQRRGAFPAYR